MNQVTSDQKDGLTKTFAIVGFIVLIIFGVWLAVKIVSFVPSTFSSLASLADSVYNYNDKQEIVINSGNDVLNAGESFTLSWADMRRPGTYTFSYACTEGVAVDVKNIEGAIVSLACSEPLQLAGATSLDILIASEKNRFVDIPYTITYTKKGDSQITSSITKDITVVNATIPATGVLVDNTPTNTTSAGEKNDTTGSTPVVTQPVTTKPTTYVAPKPKTISTPIYSIPVSNPNGIVDLQVTFLGTGTLTGSTFTKSALIDADKQGALQFEVKNIGTKTAEDWKYTAHLPADITFTSGAQKALKPNERAIITLGFSGLSEAGTEKIDVSVTAQSDVKTVNNTFAWSVIIVD